ncbi:nitrogen fixation protein NifZ [Vibrio sp. RC27]
MDGLGIRFEAGEEVRVVRNIRNDGSFKHVPKGELLIEAGEAGIVRTYGYFLQDQIIFQVYVPRLNEVVGVRDTELIKSDLEWIPCLFRSMDIAQLTVSLSMNKEVIAKKGDTVEVYRVHRDLADGALEYEVSVDDNLFRIGSRYLVVPFNDKHVAPQLAASA